MDAPYVPYSFPYTEPSFDFYEANIYNKYMTVCIAALADDRKSLILVADRENTFNSPVNTKIESNEKKIFQITKNVFILAAGTSIHVHELVEEIKNKTGKDYLSYTTSVKEILILAKKEFQRMRDEKMFEHYLRPQGFTSIEEYRERNKYPQLNDWMINDPYKIYDISLIVAGMESGRGHIHQIMSPGKSVFLDLIGFAAIGSGFAHASQSLLSNAFNKKNRSKKFSILHTKQKNIVNMQWELEGLQI